MVSGNVQLTLHALTEAMHTLAASDAINSQLVFTHTCAHGCTYSCMELHTGQTVCYYICDNVRVEYTFYTLKLLKPFHRILFKSHNSTNNMCIIPLHLCDPLCSTPSCFKLLLSTQHLSTLSHPAAPSAPLNLTFPPGGVLNDSIALTWLPPLHPNGVVQFYQLRLSTSDGDVFVNTTENTATEILSDLILGTQYNFSVRAFTVAFGPFSAQLSVHTADGENHAVHDL